MLGSKFSTGFMVLTLLMVLSQLEIFCSAEDRCLTDGEICYRNIECCSGNCRITKSGLLSEESGYCVGDAQTTRRTTKKTTTTRKPRSTTQSDDSGCWWTGCQSMQHRHKCPADCSERRRDTSKCGKDHVDVQCCRNN